MASWFITILSLGITILALPFIWRTVIRPVQTRADRLSARNKWAPLHHDLLLRIYLIAGVLATAGLFQLTYHIFTTLYKNLTTEVPLLLSRISM